MAKTVFAALMQIPSTFLNKIFSHRHDGLDQDGSAPLDYAADTGVADAYVVTFSPALTQYITGMPVRFKALNTNTGAATVNVNGLGVSAIKNTDGSDLQYGNIRKDGIYGVIYTGSVFVLINPSVRVGALLGDIISAAPAGYLKLNGAEISRVTYADLWAWAQAKSVVVTEANWSAQDWGAFSSGDLATTFRLPDLRGEFLRGFDDSRGIDSGRVLGRYQVDAFKQHSHVIESVDASGGTARLQRNASGGNLNQQHSTENTGNTVETRPRNLPVLYCIKY